MRLLLHHGADIALKDNAERKAKDIARKNGHLKVVEYCEDVRILFAFLILIHR